jgi:hypothetical protein
LKLGVTFYDARFDKPIAAGRLFEFSGTQASALGIDGELTLEPAGWELPRVHLFGEIARSDGVAGIIGATLALQRAADVVMVYRSYSPRFQGLHAQGFGERRETTNERGFYLGMDLKIARWLRLKGYLDHYRFPWRTFSNPLPASGRDFLLQAEVSPTRGLGLNLRYAEKREESAQTAVDDIGREVTAMADRIHRRLRLTVELQAGRSIRLKGRAEMTRVAYPATGRDESGLLIFQEVRLRASESLSLEARWIVFHTGSYDSRVYEYENDLRGIFTNPALYGRGVRWYLLIQWKPAEFLVFSTKYAETRKDGVPSIGSGLTEIPGDVDNRLALQLELQL